MKLLIVMAMLAARAASIEDLSGKMFTFPVQNNRARVRLTSSIQEFTAMTVCHRTFTDAKRDHGLFSLATSGTSNGFLIFWDESNREMEAHIMDQKAEFKGIDYKLNMWHSICTTWDSSTGLVQLWFNGNPTIRKFVSSQSAISGNIMIIVGQEQDAHGGGFDSKQAFVGMMTDVHVWNYALSACEIQSYTDELNFTPGNAVNWKALEHQITDKVLVEAKSTSCH
ncbi:unnamed protein product [Ophioblennius macclurei]